MLATELPNSLFFIDDDLYCLMYSAFLHCYMWLKIFHMIKIHAYR
jgi:hypothetical protein